MFRSVSQSEQTAKTTRQDPLSRRGRMGPRLTLRFSFILFGFALFGMTAVPLFTPQLNTTVPSPTPYFSATLLTLTFPPPTRLGIPNLALFALSTSFAAGGAPRGEYATILMPLDSQKALRASRGRCGCISIWLTVGRVVTEGEESRVVRVEMEKLERPMERIWVGWVVRRRCIER